MKKALYVAGPIGLALLVVGSGWSVIAPRIQPVYSKLTLVVGIVLLALGVWARRDVMFSQGGVRKARFGASAAGSVGVGLAILLLINFAAARYQQRWDLTRGGDFSLHPATLRVLQQVGKDVDVYAFWPASDQTGTRAIRELYDLFAFHQPHVKVTVADPNQRPELLEKLGGLRGTKMTAVISGERKIVFGNYGEAELASSLLEVAREKPRVVYWVIGDGERTVDAPGGAGYVKLQQSLTTDYLQLRMLSLGPGERVPEDASLLIFADARKPLGEAQAAVYNDWLRHGHRALVLADVDAEHGAEHPMEALLDQWGLRPLPAVALDPRARTGVTDPRVVVGDQFGQHAAVSSLTGMLTVFPLARPLEFFTVMSDQQIFHHMFVTAGADPTGKHNDPYVSTRLELLKQETVKVDEAEREAFRQKESKLALVLGAFRRFPTPGGADREARVVLVGDADFLNDQNIDREANRELGLNLVRWLTGEDLLIRREGEQRIAKLAMAVEPNQRTLAMALTLFLPLSTFFVGWIVWFARRSK